MPQDIENHYSRLKKIIDFKNLGLADSTLNDLVTFLDDEKYIYQILSNKKIVGVITTQLLAKKINQSRSDIQIYEHHEPRLFFYQAYNDKAKNELMNAVPSFIDPTSNIHPKAHVSDVNVIIAANVIIEAGACVLSGVRIGANSIIRAGAIIGAEGFEHKRTSQGLISVLHDGCVFIGEHVEIGANNTIAKGLMGKDTCIGNHTKTDCLVHIAHCVSIGERCLIPACAMIAGSVTIGDDVWIGPNSTISSQVKIDSKSAVTLGSVVVRDVSAGSRVTGNFAMPHTDFIRVTKRISNFFLKTKS